jgi:hypothetical protein
MRFLGRLGHLTRGTSGARRRWRTAHDPCGQGPAAPREIAQEAAMKMLTTAAVLAGLWIALAATTLATIAEAPSAMERLAPFTLTEEIIVVAPPAELADGGETPRAASQPAL